MQNGICKYCKTITCKSREIPDVHCPEQLKMLLNALRSSFMVYECNVNFLLKCLSATHDELNYLTNKYFDCTPKIIIENLKLEHTLLAIKSDCTINDVGNASGYKKLDTFRKAYKRRFGTNFENIKTLILNSPDKDEIIENLIDGLWHKKSEKL